MACLLKSTFRSLVLAWKGAVPLMSLCAQASGLALSCRFLMREILIRRGDDGAAGIFRCR